jgi:hypothetical protein
MWVAFVNSQALVQEVNSIKLSAKYAESMLALMQASDMAMLCRIAADCVKGSLAADAAAVVIVDADPKNLMDGGGVGDINGSLRIVFVETSGDQRIISRLSGTAFHLPSVSDTIVSGEGLLGRVVGHEGPLLVEQPRASSCDFNSTSRDKMLPIFRNAIAMRILATEGGGARVVANETFESDSREGSSRSKVVVAVKPQIIGFIQVMNVGSALDGMDKIPLNVQDFMSKIAAGIAVGLKRLVLVEARVASAVAGDYVRWRLFESYLRHLDMIAAHEEPAFGFDRFTRLLSCSWPVASAVIIALQQATSITHNCLPRLLNNSSPSAPLTELDEIMLVRIDVRLMRLSALCTTEDLLLADVQNRGNALLHYIKGGDVVSISAPESRDRAETVDDVVHRAARRCKYRK